MEAPLDREIVGAIFSLLKPLLAKAGYHRNNCLWYGFSRELVKVFEFESGNFKPKAYFNLGFALRTRSGPVQPRIVDCLVYGRLDVLAEDLTWLSDFSQPSSDIEARIKRLAEIVGGVALPFLNSIEKLTDLRQAYLSGGLRGFRVPRETRNIVYGIST